MPAHKESDDMPLRDPETGELDKAELTHRIKGALAVLLAFGVLLAGGIVVGGKVMDVWNTMRFADDYDGTGKADVLVVIPKNSSMIGIGQILQDAQVIKRAQTFQNVASMQPDDAKKLQAGKYKLRTEIPAALAFSMLLDPTRAVRVLLQLKEGQRLSQQAAALAAGTKIPQATFDTLLAKTSATDLGLPAWAKNTNSPTRAEGFLFPDTYVVPDNVKALFMVKQATAQFNTVTADIDFANRAKLTPVKDPYLVLIVASILEREVSRDEDRPKVARVIYNRLAKKMKLQLDSTVAYSVGKTNTIWTTDADRSASNKSKYNTYQVAGLPPGPISAPAKKSLEAALNPADGDWLYFSPVELDNGTTMFTADKAEHDRNVAQLKTWCAASPANQKKCT